LTDPQSTLRPDFRCDDPYVWLRPVDQSYVLPQEWLDSPVPEKHAMTTLIPHDVEGNDRMGAYMSPPFMDPDYGLLTMAERKLIGVVVSSINACVPCLIIHGHALGELIADHGRARRIAINYRTVELSPQDRAIADYCVKLTEAPSKMEQADLQRLRDSAICDRKIYYIVELAALFNMTNRLTAGYGMRPDEEFMSEIAPAPRA
jgi:uncharacterized peroxidase-related enzyme